MISKQALKELLNLNKIPAYRYKQILHAVYSEGKNSYNDIKVLPADLRNLLKEHVPIFLFKVANEVVARDKRVQKTLFRLNDGKCVEGVLMRFREGRNSVCVSSQVGCGLKCAFCSTGTMGFLRNLSSEEISDQVLYFDQILKKEKQRVTHVVFMGMGEPMLNYEAVMEAVRTLNDPECLNIAARHITVSTSGIIPGIKRFAAEPLQINLAVSLHAPNQSLRESLMPIAKAYKLSELMNAIKEYIKKTHRRVSYEYVMLKGINDTAELAKELGNLLHGQLCHVNLIPYNETRLGFKNAGKSAIDKFAETLESLNIPVTVRVSLGQDISAACGQLFALFTADIKQNDKSPN